MKRLGTALLVLTLLAVLVTTALAQQGSEIRVTHSATRADQPDIAIDANGNVHIAYTDEYGTSERELWYTMLDSDGNTLIDDTRITDNDGYESTRPAIVLDSTNKAHIFWRDQRWDGGSYQEVTYSKLDPYLDDMSGDPAISTTITLIDDTRMSNNQEWYMFGIRAAVDSNDDIHIVWDNDDDNAIYYTKIDADGNELVPETVIRSASQWRALPDLALDSSDNLHLAWADYIDTSSDEVYYMMLDNVGNVMIDATLLTPDDNEYSKWTGIAVDRADQVHIVWQDDSGANKEIWYTKLDPSLDDQDGDAADADVITVIEDVALTPDDGVKSRHPVIATDGNLLHVTWEEDDDDNIHYMVLGSNGHVILDNTPLTISGTAYPSTYWTLPYTDIDADGTAHVVWCDSRDGDYEVYYTNWHWTLGYMEGHVYDAVTLDPVEGALVSAGGGGDTDASGYYTFTTAIGVYTATAEHPHYTTAYSVGVEILTGTVTTADFYLVPRGRLYGYVSDYDTGNPLEATIVVSGVGSLRSDPASGYYEIYVDAGSYDLQAIAEGYFTGTATVDLTVGGETRQDFSLVYGVLFEPGSLHITLDWQTTSSVPVTLTNRLPVSYPFDFPELDRGFIPALLGEPVEVVLPAGPAQAPPGTALAEDPNYTPSPERTYTIPPGRRFLAAPDVLIARADSDAEPLMGLLQAYGDLGALDDMDVRYSTPVLDDLLPYDVVITWGNHCYQDNDAMGDVLADYIDAGGRVLNSMFGMNPDSCESARGRYWDEDYIAVKTNSWNYSMSCLGVYDAGHPIMEGVTAACAYYRLSGSYLTPDSHDVAQFADGSTFVAAKNDSSVVNVVAFMGGTDWSGQVPDMIHNAIFWQNIRPDLPWFEPLPVTGTVPASDTLGVTLFFSATYAAGVDQPGDYRATLRLGGYPDLAMPVTMTVLPPAGMGKVEGYVTDRCLGDPIEATVSIPGGVPITETTAFPDGYYAAWLVSGSYDLVFTASGYLPYSATVDIVAGMTETLDVILFPDRACIAIEPAGFEVWLLSGTLVYTHPSGLDLTNLGGQDLDFEIVEYTGTLGLAAGSGAPLAPQRDVAPSDDPSAFPSTPTPPSGIQATGVLLIQDSEAWSYPAMETILTNYGIPYDLINSSQISATNFSPYRMILIPSVQGSAYNTAFNDNLALFEAYIDAGGTVLMSFCTQTSHTPYILPPFGGTNIRLGANDNYIEDPSHPIFEGVSNPYSGSSASHNYLTNLLPEDRILVTQGTAPGGNVVMIERDHGAGLLVAGSQTFEYGWANGWDNGIILENMIPYYYYQMDVPWIWEEPITGTVASDYAPLATGHVDVMFSSFDDYPTASVPLPLGDYDATLIVRNNDPVAGTQRVPAILHVVGQFVTPTANLNADSPGCLNEAMVMTFTGDLGVPAADPLWSFGDGMTDTGTIVSHTYAAAGSYTVTVELCSPQTGWCDSFADSVEVLPTTSAGFSSLVDQLTVTFTNTSLTADTYLWEFGDGLTSTLEHPIHAYAVEGSYTVTLHSWGLCGHDMAVDGVTVGLAPAAGFAHNAPVCLGNPVTFTNLTSGTLPIDYIWWFGDGMTSTLEHPTHTYAVVTTYTISLDAANAFGLDSAVDVVEVLPLPAAGFTYTTDALIITFTNLSANASDYLWAFGDGNTSTATHPVHAYAVAGTYTVTLDATGPCGAETTGLVLTVEEPGYFIYLPLVFKGY